MCLHMFTYEYMFCEYVSTSICVCRTCIYMHKVRSPNFGHVWKLCCETSTPSSVFSMRLVLTIPSVSFFEKSYLFDILMIKSIYIRKSI